MTDPIDPFQTPEPEDYLAELVGEGKQYADAAALAKATAHKERHIQTLEAELASLRKKDLDGNNVETLLAEIQKLKAPTEGSEGQPLVQPQIEPPNIEDAVLATLSKYEQTKRLKDNKQATIQKMNEVWGNDAAKNLQETATNLGVSVEYLQGVAQQSPSAFFQMTGLNQSRTVPSGTQVPTSTVNMPGGKVKVRNSSYYRELRRTNPALYKSSATQVQEQQDAETLGEAFFD